ncbi:MAG: enoyl-CoA hydratase/isomerase family protein, partial [Bdellovibrionales bacterium]|nr:enoyl-CoA hydratase/isomerase family protein [Bdellovibrionales bacterium]
MNRPQKMNAFNLEMFQALQNALLNWQADESILYIFLDSSHEKAFSAGGDVSEVRQNHLTGETHFAQNYFKVEYGLDYFIHKFPKPILCWSQGVVMGAGLGVMNGCSHRIVTQNTLMAMPEVKIGLFPDVGASYFLNKISKNLGLFFALTGVSWSGEEACEFGLADFYLDSGDKEKVFSYLKSIPWGTFNRSEIHEVLNQELKQMEGSLPKKEICLEGLDEVLQVNDFSEIHNI